MNQSISAFRRSGGWAIPLCLLLLAACGGQPTTPPPAPAAADPHAGHDHGSGVIALPELVQRNLGITWATAEYRVVQGVLRMPGRFEAEPSARRAYLVPTSGRIELQVAPYQRVAAGDLLYRLHAAEWRRLQLELAEAQVAVEAAPARLVAVEEQVAALEAAIGQWRTRQETLERLGRELGGSATELAEAAARSAELHVDLAQARRDLAEARSQAGDGGQARLRQRLLLAQAAQLTGRAEADLLVVSDGLPLWATLPAIEVRARGPGLVEGDVHVDGWTEVHETALTVTDPTGVRLRAAGLQADLPRLRDGLPARIVASDPAVAVAIQATLVISPMADAIDRSVDLIARPAPGGALPAWVRPGVTANLEVVIAGSPEEELAIPLAATIRDGLKTMFYRRDPHDPGAVVPVEADLGANDGRFVAVLSGLKEGDQVVLGGIYPLKLSQQQGGSQAGHFDPDGTFHTGKH